MGKKVVDKGPSVVTQAVERVIEKLDEVSTFATKLEYKELLEELASDIEARLDWVNDELKEEQA